MNLFIKKTKEITSIELRLDATVKAYNIIFLTQPCNLEIILVQIKGN